ncbi:DUF418 domain-containing protein [Georgenia sp. Z1344]|uniref:DUF418 domain-containing protein n=1 Tax=Georgenia sp. Z1344 TaxID=3416706 RepID=UPI003CE97ECF
MDRSTTTTDPGPARALAPDLARGLMLALIAVANVAIYLHDRPYGLRQHIVEDGVLDRAVTLVVALAVDARAYPLFAALFGYGLVRIADRQRDRGLGEDDVRRLLRRRSLWLVAFGAGHALLGFSGDILGWYGLLGLVLAGVLQISDRALLRAAVVWLVVASAIQGLVYADGAVTTQRGHMWSFAIGDPIEALVWRPVEWLMGPVGLLTVGAPMLVGVWAGRRRILERPEAHLSLLRRTAGVGITVGLLGGVGTAMATARVWTPGDIALVGWSWLHILTGVLAGLGYAAAVTLLARRLGRDRDGGAGRRVIDALRATGERSLSCYLAQSVIFVALLPAWTLGLGGDLGTAAASGLALLAWLLTVLGADALARRGRRGPAEAVLRRLTYGVPSQPTRSAVR